MEAGDVGEQRVARFQLRASGRALTMGDDADHGSVKLIADAYGRILGGDVVGSQAESLISEIVLAVEMGATAEDIALTVHPHPTLSEGIAEAAERLLGEATHVLSRGVRRANRRPAPEGVAC